MNRGNSKLIISPSVSEIAPYEDAGGIPDPAQMDAVLRDLDDIMSLNELHKRCTPIVQPETQPFLLWYRLCRSFYKQAVIYQEECDFVRAYIYYLKYAVLVIDVIPKHPESRLAKNRAILDKERTAASNALDLLESLKEEVEAFFLNRVKNEVSELERDLGDDVDIADAAQTSPLGSPTHDDDVSVVTSASSDPRIVNVMTLNKPPEPVLSYRSSLYNKSLQRRKAHIEPQEHLAQPSAKVRIARTRKLPQVDAPHRPFDQGPGYPRPSFSENRAFGSMDGQPNKDLNQSTLIFSTTNAINNGDRHASDDSLQSSSVLFSSLNTSSSTMYTAKSSESVGQPVDAEAEPSKKQSSKTFDMIKSFFRGGSSKATAVERSSASARDRNKLDEMGNQIVNRMAQQRDQHFSEANTHLQRSYEQQTSQRNYPYAYGQQPNKGPYMPPLNQQLFLQQVPPRTFQYEGGHVLRHPAPVNDGNLRPYWPAYYGHIANGIPPGHGTGAATRQPPRWVPSEYQSPTGLVHGRTLARRASMLHKTQQPNTARTFPVAKQSEDRYVRRAFLENGEVLRTMHIPTGIVPSFLAIADRNTRKGIETCGILCGVLMENEIWVSTLLIPKQNGTSDTCSTTNEDEIFEYLDKEGLLTLGWIHTHPTQTCFMSSVDVHTHCSYQLLLPEAVAIVCSPMYTPSVGIFRLTNPPGVQTVSKCRNPSPFHPHPNVPIYVNVLEFPGNGHVDMYDIPSNFENLSLNVIDMRH